MRSSLVLLLLLAACGGEKQAAFRGKAADAWIRALEDPDTRGASHAELAQGGEEALPLLRDLLESESTIAGLVAADLLGALGDRALTAVPDLVKALDDERLRGMAAASLGRIGSNAAPALDRLRELYDDPDERVRVAAARASWLISKDPREPVAALIYCLESGTPAVRQMAAASLGEIGKPAVEALIAALGAGDPRTRASAAEALAAIGPDAASARQALYQALKDENTLVKAAANRALQAIR